VVVAQRSHRVAVESPPGPGRVAGSVQVLGDLGVGELPVAAGELDRRLVGATPFDDPHEASDDDLVRRPGVPADPYTRLGEVRLGDWSRP
jgi:hypothetical protein